MKITYLTWGETPRSYGVFASQVIAQFSATQKAMPEANFSFISAIPLIHSGFTREKLSYIRELNKVRTLLEVIPFFIIPIYTTQNFVNSSKLTFPLMHYGAHWHLGKKLVELSPDIVHCRAYHAAWAALTVKKKLNLNYKVIFDARGLWPEEIALKRKWTADNKNYVYLKAIEKYLLKESDTTVSVSDPMTEHYQNIGEKNIETIYLSAPVKKFRKATSYTPAQSSTTTLCYIGALANNTWHQPKFLVDCYMKFRECVSNPKLIVVTTSKHIHVQQELSNIPTEELTITSSKNTTELLEILKVSDFGVLPYRVAEIGYESMVARTVLAIKTVEYLAAGLPVLVNQQCVGAASIISKYNLGIAYDPRTFEGINPERLHQLKSEETSMRAKQIALNLFEYESNAKRYVNLYESII